jgi:hypothetical protein
MIAPDQGAQARKAQYAFDNVAAGGKTVELRNHPRFIRTSSHTGKESAMQANVGTVDRVLRISIGLALIALAATGHIGAWGWIGILPLVTGIVRICPAYSIVGVKTCSASRPDTK